MKCIDKNTKNQLIILDSNYGNQFCESLILQILGKQNNILQNMLPYFSSYNTILTLENAPQDRFTSNLRTSVSRHISRFPQNYMDLSRFDVGLGYNRSSASASHRTLYYATRRGGGMRQLRGYDGTRRRLIEAIKRTRGQVGV